MKINKFKGLGILLVLSVFLVLPMVMAATVLVAPTAGTNHTGTMIVNCTTAVANAINATVYYNATGGPSNQHATALITITNTTDSQAVFTDTAVSISSLGDLATYNFSCYADGDTQELSASDNSGITIDNTKPVVNLEIPFDGGDQSYGGVLNYKCSLADAIDSDLTTQSFSVAHPSGDLTTSTTLTRNYATFKQFTDTDYTGDYVFTCAATDYTGNTQSVSATVTIDELGRMQSVSTSNGSSSNIWLWVGLIALAFFLLNQKK